MRPVLTHPPFSEMETVTEPYHGVSVTDPYRWLEDQGSPRTREWIETQAQYARCYLDSSPGRSRIRDRIRELVDVEGYDSLQVAAGRYFFRKRLPNQEQPCIYVREGATGEDRLLIDPTEWGTDKYTAVKPLNVSRDGRLLLFEVKQGGERTGTFELLEIESRRHLPDSLPHGHLRGFAFDPDGRSFCYVHETANRKQPHRRAAYRHRLGTDFGQDQEVFFAGWGDTLRLCLVSDASHIGFLVRQFGDRPHTDFYVKPWDGQKAPQQVIRNAEYRFGALLHQGRILLITDRDAPNFRIVELQITPQGEVNWVDLIPSSAARIHQWTACGNALFVSYIGEASQRVCIFDLNGNKTGELPLDPGESVQFLARPSDCEEFLFESESFTTPATIKRYSSNNHARTTWIKNSIPFDSLDYERTTVTFTSKDGTEIPMHLVGRPSVVKGACAPAIMTSYGGFAVPMTPQFSVFVAFLIEQGCLFALPQIRGGSEFGTEWYEAARRQKRQTAFDDFLAAAEWLVRTGRTTSDRFAIFGGSNSGLLVAAAMTQRPELFRAVVCIAPLLDMLRFHRFDNAQIWREEFGTAEDPRDFEALMRYSPYHRVVDGVSYPATMIVSGDADSTCNPLHARKMTARLQAANSSPHPILLDYTPFRGHCAVLPLSVRLEALTDRMAFLWEQLQLPV